MKRIHLFEFTDLPWYPNTFRCIQTDYLQFVTTLGSGHKNLVPLITKAMQYAETTEIVDLCSGGAGPWMELKEYLKQSGFLVTIKLTDKYPNPEALQKWSGSSHQGIEYLFDPVDAMNVPPQLKGMRTLFEGFHHFKPEQARGILQDASEKKVAIGIFEANLKPPLGLILLLLAPLTTFISYLLMTPLIRPHTLSRFFWTYLIPIVPLASCWDGVISLLRVYSLHDLKELIDPIQSKEYIWEMGRVSTGTPIFEFIYCLGYPCGKHKIYGLHMKTPCWTM
jgi:hypothetical protein